MILQGADRRFGPSFSLGNRVARGLWGVVWLCLFRPSPRTFHAWRGCLLTLFGARLGEHFRIHGSARVWAPWQFEAGDRVGVGERVNLYNMAPMVIGDDAVISQGSHLCGGTHDYTTENFQLEARPITIGAKAWICTEAFIGPGVHVPEGCVVGARSVMTRTPKDGPWHVYAGNPVRCVKQRVMQKT